VEHGIYPIAEFTSPWLNCAAITPIFLLPVKNLTSPSCTPTPISCIAWEFWRYVNILGRYCVFHICMNFQDLRVKNGDFRGKIGERVGRYWPPTNSFLLLGVYTSVSNLVKIHKEMRSWEWRHTDRQTHTHTDTQTQTDFIICPMLYAIAMGQIITTVAGYQKGIPIKLVAYSTNNIRSMHNASKQQKHLNMRSNGCANHGLGGSPS